MKTTHRFAARTLAAALIAALTASAAFAQDVPAAPKGTARLVGRVVRADGKTPVENAVVRACYLDDGRSFASGATRPDGEFSVGDLPSGYADVAVETPQGVFVVNQVMQFLPGKKQTAELVLTLYSERPAEWWGTTAKRQVPCSSGESAGSADIRATKATGSFLKSPAGIALLAGGGAALVLLAVSGGSNDDSSASPSQP